MYEDESSAQAASPSGGVDFPLRANRTANSYLEAYVHTQSPLCWPSHRNGILCFTLAHYKPLAASTVSGSLPLTSPCLNLFSTSNYLLRQQSSSSSSFRPHHIPSALVTHRYTAYIFTPTAQEARPRRDNPSRNGSRWHNALGGQDILYYPAGRVGHRYSWSVFPFESSTRLFLQLPHHSTMGVASTDIVRL